MATDSILITGSSGTIGTALAEALLDEGYEVIGVDSRPNRWSDTVDERTHVADLANKSALDELSESPDRIVHLAANARVHHLVENPALAKENLDTTYNTLEYARRTDTDLVFSSSREVYGNTGKIIYDETDTYVDECESPYTASKIGGEALVKSYEKCYGIETSIVRFSNVYGKYDASNRVIPLFIAQADRGDDLTVYGEHKVLDFTYLDDCVSGIIKLHSRFNKATGSTFNIASGQGTSLVEVAELIADSVNPDVDVHTEPNRTGEVGRYVADISKAEKILNYDPSYDVQTGLEAAIDWYLSRPELFETILD